MAGGLLNGGWGHEILLFSCRGKQERARSGAAVRAVAACRRQCVSSKALASKPVSCPSDLTREERKVD